MSYYDKILASNQKSQPRHSKKLVNLDDSLAQEESGPDIFGQSKPTNVQKGGEKKIETIKGKESPVKIFQIEKKPEVKTKPENSQKPDLKLKKNKTEQLQKQANRIQFVNKQQIEDELSADEPEVHGVSKKSWLSIFESFNLSLGHYFYTYNFPIRREIPIIANNLDLERQKYQNGTYISQSFDNNLQVSFFLFFLRAVLIENFLRVSVILWILAIVLSYMIDSKEQYRPGRQILLGIFLFNCLMSVILQFWSLRGRRVWQQPSINTKYKVYHFDNQTRSAEWVMTDVADLRPGNIYKVPPSSLNNPSVIPADSVLLHSPRTILQVDESLIIEYLSPLQKQQRISLKQTLIKTDIIMLPLTGVVHYQLAAPEIVGQNIYGRFTQQEPNQQTFNIGYSNVVLRGTKILSSQLLVTDDSDRKLEQKQSQILAVVLETGIDSLVLKTSQYPYQYRKSYTYSHIMDNLLIVSSILYLLVTGAGVLIGYIYLANQAKNRGYYIDTYLDVGETPVTLGEIVLHHFANLIMIVPILIRISYLLFVNFAGRIANSKMNIQIKDYNMLAEAKETDVLVTTIGSDLIRMGTNKYAKQAEEGKTNIFDASEDGQLTIRNRSLQSIRVSGIHHNFFTTRIDNQLYSTKDVDMICYFMSIALLTCNRKNPTPLEGGIIERCNKQLNVKLQKFGTTIKIGQLKVIKIFTMPATERFPFKIVFYRHSKQAVEDMQNTKIEFQQKVLGLIRGQPGRLSNKISEVDGHLLSEFSNKLHQQKGYHIELLGKFVLSYEDFLEIKRAYMNSSITQTAVKTQSKKSFEVSKLRNDESMNSTNTRYKFGIDKFYENLDRYMPKIDPMGLLVWENPYSVLSTELSPISSLPQPQFKIIIAPPSKSQTNPQFESVHAITNYLLKTSKLSLKEISNKILHNYSNQQTFWSLLNSQKILVLNGWDYRMIKKMLSDLKEVKRASKKPVRLLSYIEQDEYGWILKQSDVSISTKGDGHDLQKYSDILINPDATSTTTDIIRRLFYYSYAYSYCLKSIIIVQFMKSILLATVEFINLFYTWGTALVIIGSPLYLILEVGLLFDFLYYLYPRIDTDIWDSDTSQKQLKNVRGKPSTRKQKNPNNDLRVEQIIIEIFSAIVVGSFITFIPMYSMTEPPTPNGTVEPKQFTNLLIHFILYHVVVLRKIFMRPYTFSIYKLFVLMGQLGVYYIGIVIVSAVDSYQYKGVIWFVIEGKIILIAIFVVWMVIGVYWLVFMIENLLHPKPKSIKNRYEKIPNMAKKHEELSANQIDIKVGQVVDIE